MRFAAHSNVWLEEFGGSFDSIIGKSYYEVLPDTPLELKEIHLDCLGGAINKNNGKKIISSNGTIQWLKWKINAWKDHNEEIGGLIIVQEDITEAKRREELLLRAEKVARIGGWEIDMTSNRVFWTQVTKEIHEVPEDFVPDLEGGINFYKKGKSRDEITRLVSQALEDGTPWDTELILVTAKNNELWVRAKGETEIVNGKCVRIYGTFQDIDKQKKIELKFAEAKERLEVATKGAKIGIWEYDIETNALVWDDNMYALYGIQKSDFNGEYEAWQAGLLPADKARGDKEIELAISGEKEFNTMFRVVWPNGEIRHIRAIAVSQFNNEGKVVKLIGTNWDITELKTTQLQLLRNRIALKETFQNSAVGLAMVDLDGTFKEVNQSLCDTLGYTESEFYSMSFVDITHPEDLAKDLVLLQKIIDRKQDTYQTEKRYYHKNKSIVYSVLTVTAGKNLNGELSYFNAQIINISNRKAIEKELIRAVAIAKDQNESLLNFAHIVSHNLRSHSSNMTMISGFLDKEENADEQKALLAMLRDAANGLMDTVTHLNEVVHVKLGTPEIMKSINLFETIKNVEKNLNQLLEEKNAVCHIHLSEDINIQGVQAYLDSIFLNLFTNSIRYSSPERNPVITISAFEEDNSLILLFSDNGLGINLDRHRKKIFGMYKTFHKNKDAKGIGLYMTKNQLEAMDGKISVESTEGSGTTFKLIFKLTA